MRTTEATIKLFNALPVSGEKAYPPLSPMALQLLGKTVSKGFVFSPEIISAYSLKELENIADEIGITAREMNNSFHKSWGKVRDASIEQLIIEQIVHYLTTYGFERLGVYDKDLVYIPLETLDIPELKSAKLVVVKGYCKQEIKEKLLSLLQSGVALKEDTQEAAVTIALYLGLTEQEIEGIKNKETKLALYVALGIFPSKPIEFLRYIVFMATNNTLLIKNSETIAMIKENQNLWAVSLFAEYEREHGLSGLAEIFFRFKPLFLAFKTNPRLNNYVNRIRKLALKHHKAMPQDYLNTVTARIKRGRGVADLGRELEAVNVFRKIRLAQALRYRTKEAHSILYKIRNGKSFATDFNFNDKASAQKALNIVLLSIEKGVRSNVEGKRIYIPSYVEYALPATEKAFTGNFPAGTCIKLDSSMLVGIHWQNVGFRVDLDLSSVSSQGAKVGWDAAYRTTDKTVLFSGDMTDAPGPKGASELLYAEPGAGKYILFVNYYNFREGVKVPFKIVIAQEKPRDFKRNCIIDPNNMLSVSETVIDKRQKILGLLVAGKECRFYFIETSIGGSISSGYREYTRHAIEYLSSFYENPITLNSVLEKAGAAVVADKNECDIDLSPESLEKDTLLKLVGYKDL